MHLRYVVCVRVAVLYFDFGPRLVARLVAAFFSDARCLLPPAPLPCCRVRAFG